MICDADGGGHNGGVADLRADQGRGKAPTLLLTCGVGQLASQFFEPESPSGHGVLFIHGWRSDRTSPAPLAQRLKQIGVTSLAFDLPGHGESDGDISTLNRQQFLDGCLAAYDALAARPEVESVGIVGSSFGGYLACVVADARSPQTLVLRAPANYSEATFHQPQAMESDALDNEGVRLHQSFGDSRSLRCLRSFEGDVLVVVSGRDEIVGTESTNAYIDAAASKGEVDVKTFENALHNFDAATKLEYAELLADWFGRKVLSSDR